MILMRISVIKWWLTWRDIEYFFKELCWRVGDDGVGCDEVKEKHDLHSDLLPPTGHRQNNIVLDNISQSKIATCSHGEVDAEQN